jgi:hypothetical protein
VTVLVFDIEAIPVLELGRGIRSRVVGTCRAWRMRDPLPALKEASPWAGAS